jgi:Zn-dependent protease
VIAILWNLSDWKAMIYILPSILFGLTMHEFFHGFTAYKMGDNTPLEQGRLTLNPIPHLDLIGFLMMILVGFGWAKPVQIDPGNFRKPKLGEVLVSLAGPAANLVLAVLFGLIFKTMVAVVPALFQNSETGKLLANFFIFGIWINLVLAVFNLFPIPPLDGSHLLMLLIPDRYYEFKRKLLQFGSIALILLLVVGDLLHLDLLPVAPLTKLLFNWLVNWLAI